MKQGMIGEVQRRLPGISNELGPDNLARLLESCTLVDLAPRRRLFRDRMPVESIYLILDGELVATVEDGGNTLEIGKVGIGDWLGEVAVLSGEMVAMATVTTKTQCRALKMHHRDFEQLVLQDPEISHVLLGNLVTLLTQRLQHAMLSANSLRASWPG